MKNNKSISLFWEFQSFRRKTTAGIVQNVAQPIFTRVTEDATERFQLPLQYRKFLTI
jgi:hypothetical protein